MGFHKIETLSLTDMFIQQIENMILSGELEVGEQLPAARELSVRMGVSRPVISAGLIELEKLGFVEIRPRIGVYVSDYRRKGSFETLAAIMRYNGGAMRRSEVRSLMEVRERMECLCIELVADKAPQELESLGPILEALKAAKDNDAAAEQIFNFHHELSVLSGNSLLPLLYYSFKPQGLYLWAMNCKRSGIAAMYETKLKLYRLLLEGDSEGAKAHTRRAIGKAVEELSFYGA